MEKRKILVIAEIRGAGVVLLMILRKEGYEVIVVDPFAHRSLPKGYKGLDEALSESKFDLIVPTNNGFPPGKILELVPEIRKKDPVVKIIVMSGYDKPEFVRELWEKGIDDFMPLPFQGEDLVARVKKCLPE
jgi:DNA-binding response OmpR family regulator